jgi:hypothetical protein
MLCSWKAGRFSVCCWGRSSNHCFQSIRFDYKHSSLAHFFLLPAFRTLNKPNTRMLSYPFPVDFHTSALHLPSPTTFPKAPKPQPSPARSYIPLPAIPPTTRPRIRSHQIHPTPLPTTKYAAFETCIPFPRSRESIPLHIEHLKKARCKRVYTCTIENNCYLASLASTKKYVPTLLYHVWGIR